MIIKMKGQYSISVAATILLGIASSAAQTSSFEDPMTGEPIQLISRSEMRRNMQENCDEAIHDETGETYYHPTTEQGVGAVW